MGAPTSADTWGTTRLRDFAVAAAIFAGSLGISSILQHLTGWTFLMVPVAGIVATGLVAGRSAALASLVAHAIAYVLLFGDGAFGVGLLARWRITVFVGVGAFVALVAGSVRAASRRLATERRAAQLATARAEASEERFRRIAENAPDVVYRCRLAPERAFEYVSPAVTRLTGYPPEEHYRDPGLAERLVVPEDLAALRFAFAGGDTAGPFLLRLRRRDGAIVWTEQRMVMLRDEAGVAVALEGIARDVTTRVEAERAREAFLSIASHELRTPLAALVLQLGLLRRGAGENAELLRRVDSCDRQAHRLEGLVSTLLDASRIRTVSSVGCSSLSVLPGAIALTVIPWGPASRASVRVNPRTPAFEAT